MEWVIELGKLFIKTRNNRHTTYSAMWYYNFYKTAIEYFIFLLKTNFSPQVHLAKCQKQYPNQRISICPFDATHYVKTEELDVSSTSCDTLVVSLLNMKNGSVKC